MTTATLSAQAQVTFDQTLLEHLGVAPGGKISIQKLPDGSLKLVAEKKGDILALAGSIKTNIHASDEEIQRAIEHGYARAGVKGLE